MGGLRDWNDAVTWANTLSFGGFDDWRLPSTTQPDPTCSNQYDPGAGLPVQGFLLNCLLLLDPHLVGALRLRHFLQLGNVGIGSVTEPHRASVIRLIELDFEFTAVPASLRFV